MSNHHLKNKALSLKAKGLLSQMLSLPENWDYTLKGLSFINRDSRDAIRSAVIELEEAGYICRRQTVDPRGKFSVNEYVIYELPQKPSAEKPSPENPTAEKPTTESTLTEKPTQSNIDITNTEKPNTHLSATNQSGINQSAARGSSDAMGYEEAKAVVKKNIEYDLCRERVDRDMLDELVEITAEILCSTKPTYFISGSDYPAEMVKERIKMLTCSHIEYIIDSIWMLSTS